MQISLKWINELVNIETYNLEDLVEKLTLGGFEVEKISEIEVNKEMHVVLDVTATANRSDSLSIQGLSIELATLLNQKSKILNYSVKPEIWKQNLNNLAGNLSTEYNCSIFLTFVVENLTNISVPRWVTEKLLSSEVTPFNNLLDFQNYVLLETGYPLAFYDFNKIRKKLKSSEINLSLSLGKNKQKFLAGNNLEYELDNSILLVKANKMNISIAGIIEDQEFSYSKTTNSLLIEGSIFSAAKIRQQSRSLGLRTDRSARYEKSLKDTYIIESIYRLISLLRISNPNLTCKLHTFSKVNEQTLKTIQLKYKTIKEILGPIKEHNYLVPATISDYLKRLNFKFLYQDSKLIWKVEIPHSRTNDLNREIDLIEEIGRLHGFKNFLTTLPKIKKIGTEDFSYKTRKKITACFLNLGFNELINYSLVNKTTFVNNEIKLINPLLSDYSNLRSSLLPSLIKTFEENLKQGNLFIEGFEFGHIFSLETSDCQTNFQEKEYIAGIFGGIKTKLTWSDSNKVLTWFEAKGKIEQLFEQLNLSISWKTDPILILANILHPYRSAHLYFNSNVSVGIFGQIHPILANQLSISPELYLFEFDLEMIQNQMIKNKLTIYKKYFSYPKIIKDLSFLIKRDTQFTELKEILYLNGTEFLSEVNLLDEYRGPSIPEKSTSLCLQLIFQSNKKTLQNKEIENIVQKLQQILIQKFGVKIRE